MNGTSISMDECSLGKSLSCNFKHFYRKINTCVRLEPHMMSYEPAKVGACTAP